MTPLLFILVATAVIILLVYWVLSTVRDDYQPFDRSSSYFETASELGPYDYSKPAEPVIPLDRNEVKLSRPTDLHLVACWNVSLNKWQEKIAEINQRVTEENITLRVFQTSAGVKSFDIPVKSLRGRHEFFCRPGTSYYVVLGILQVDFIPLIFSNTVIVPPRPEPAN
ncbi:MAG: hypothetical protein ACOX6I_05195 [Syntrophomonadaceae bacterium]|jgi:hypothetical protein